MPLIFLSFIVSILARSVPLVSPITFKRSLVFPIFLYIFSLLTSPCYSLELCLQLGISFPFSTVFASLVSPAICKVSLDKHFAFLHWLRGSQACVTQGSYESYLQGHQRWTSHGGEFWQNVLHWRREWQTTSVFSPQEPHEQYGRWRWDIYIIHFAIHLRLIQYFTSTSSIIKEITNK